MIPLSFQAVLFFESNSKRALSLQITGIHVNSIRRLNYISQINNANINLIILDHFWSLLILCPNITTNLDLSISVDLQAGFSLNLGKNGSELSSICKDFKIRAATRD